MRNRGAWIICTGALLSAAIGCAAKAAGAGELVPAVEKIKTDRPRLLLRPKATPLAITLDQLKAVPRDEEFKQMLVKLRGQKNAACQAMVYLLTGEKAAADKAVQRLRALTSPPKADSFAIYFRLMEAALAYDWLHGYAGFTDAIKAEVRGNLGPLAARGARVATDHIFHNYTWMAAGGTMLWALATAGDDAEADKLFATMRARLNNDLYPGMAYLDGQAGESPGYWTLYDLSPCALSLLATQSAFETDVIGRIKRDEGNWLGRQLDNVIFLALPNLRYVTWGDIQSGGDGGVAHEVVGVTDGMSWALASPQGVRFSQWVAKKRGLRRYYGLHAMFYFIYTRNLTVKPADPPLAFLAGGVQGTGDPGSGAFVARSGWGDGDTVVAFRCTDFYGGHNHFDAGSFVIYRNGHLAVDPDLYKRVGGSQQRTNVHNTLLIGGKGQRRLRAQWFKDVADYKRNLTGGKKLETGDILFFKDTPRWSAVVGRFAQAYTPAQVKSCVRQLLFVRPCTVIVVDQLVAPGGEVQWQLMVAAEPKVAGRTLTVSNGKSWLVCRGIHPASAGTTVVEPSLKKNYRTSTTYRPADPLRMVHVLQVGDGEAPAKAADASVKVDAKAIEVTVDQGTFVFACEAPFEVKPKQ